MINRQLQENCHWHLYPLATIKFISSPAQRLISVGASEVKAKAAATRIYRVILTNKQSRLDGQCSCPAFEDFGPRKHMAAVGFTVMASQSGGYHLSKVCVEHIEQQTDFEKALRKKTKSDLVSIILRLSDYYPEILEEIMDEEYC